MRSTVQLFLLLVFAALVPHAYARTHDLAITNVTVIDGNGRPPQQNTNVYVSDGRIAAVTQETLPDGATEVVDGTGKYLIPGLIDAHTHPFPIDENFPRFIHFGVTSILITGCSSCTNENLARARSLWGREQIPSPRVCHTSQHFTMEGRHPVKTYPSASWVEGKTVFYVREVDDVESYVEEVAKQPIVGIKVTIEDGPEPPFVEFIPVEFVAEIVKQAHARDLKVFAHVSTMEGLRIAEAAGADHLLHFVGIDIDWSRDRELVDRLHERDPSWVTTLMVDKGFLYPAHPEWTQKIEATQVYDSKEIEGLKRRHTAEQSLDILRTLYGTDNPTVESIIGPQVDDLRQLHEEGFNIVVGTDTGNDFIFPGISMHEEMELLSRRFEPSELLRMATRNPAEMLGVLDELGTIEVGK